MKQMLLESNCSTRGCIESFYRKDGDELYTLREGLGKVKW